MLPPGFIKYFPADHGGIIFIYRTSIFSLFLNGAIMNLCKRFQFFSNTKEDFA